MMKPNGRTPEQVLVIRASGRERASALRTAMRHYGVEYKCAICDMGPIWNSRQLVLQVDHIDGNYLDSRLHNLRFLCPNCHTQTETFGRAKKAAPVVTCKGYLTDSDRLAILKRYGSEYDKGKHGGVPVAQIAETYGVSLNTVYRLLRASAVKSSITPEQP